MAYTITLSGTYVFAGCISSGWVSSEHHNNYPYSVTERKRTKTNSYEPLRIYECVIEYEVRG